MPILLPEHRPERKPRMAVPTFLAYAAGTIFALSSAATNLSYAVTRVEGIPQQIIWGAVAVAASVALALAPSAIVSSLSQRRYGAAILSLVAMLTFGGYSVTAALGSATGGRLVAEVEAGDVAMKRKDATATIGKAERELAAISTMRSAATVQAEIASVLAKTPGLDDCTPHPNWKPTKAHREACKTIATLGIEKASAERKAELELAITSARAVLDNLKAGRTVANSDALALQGFAGALGLHVEVDTLNRLLVVLAVLVIELGGGLAFAVAGGLGAERITVDHREPKPAPTTQPERQQTQVIQGEPTRDSAPPIPITPIDGHADRLIRLLQDRGGQVIGGQRAVASLLNTSQATVNRTLQSLVESGRITVETSRTGTKVALVALN